MRTGIIIQARMASSRLPGKVLIPICEKPLLWHLLERVTRTKGIDEIIVATTTSPCDDAVFNFCKEKRVRCFRGSEQDVLNRFSLCATHYHLDLIIRVTADNPLTDPEGIKRLLERHRVSGADYVHNKHRIGWPFGTGAELITSEALSFVTKEAKEQHHREHVTLFIREHPERFTLVKINAPDYLRRCEYYLTVDYPEDLTLMTILFHRLYNGNGPFSLGDAIAYLDENPHLVKINTGLHQGFSE